MFPAVWWVLGGLLAALLLLATVAYVLGSRMPEEHTTSVVVETAAPVATVWRTATDFAAQTAWVKGLRRVERLPDRDGREVWREHFGGHPITLEVTERVEERRLVRTIADERGPFSGRWEYAFEATPEGSRVTVTEHGRVRSPIARFVMARTFGFDWFLKRWAEALARRVA